MGMYLTFTNKQHVYAFQTAFYEQFDEASDLSCHVGDSGNYAFVKAGIKELGDIATLVCGDASNIPPPRRHAINALAKEFGGSWDDEPTVESVAYCLSRGPTSEQEIEEILADSGLSEADQRLAFDWAREELHEHRKAVEAQCVLVDRMHRDSTEQKKAPQCAGKRERSKCKNKKPNSRCSRIV